MTAFTAAGMLYNLVKQCLSDKLTKCKLTDLFDCNPERVNSKKCREINFEVPQRHLETFFLVSLGPYPVQMAKQNRDIGFQVNNIDIVLCWAFNRIKTFTVICEEVNGKISSVNEQLSPENAPEKAKTVSEDSVLVPLSTLENIQSRLDELALQDSESSNALSPQNIGEELNSTFDLPGTISKVVFSLFVIFLAYLLIKAFVYGTERIAERRPSQRLFYKRIIPIIRIAIWVIVFSYLAFSVFGPALLPAAAAFGVAVGFAGQEIVKNIFGGLTIIIDQPFQTGDRIRVGNSYGEVVSIGLRSTRIQTLDDNLVTIPNSEVMASQVSNANAGELNCQVVTDLYLPGWIDESEAKEVAYNAASSSKYVFRKKPIVVLVKDKYEHGFVTQLQVKAYVLDTRFESLFMSDVTERARAEFRKRGLIPKYHGAHTVVDIARQVENGSGKKPNRTNKWARPILQTLK